jgi:hypothetical protein
MDYITKIETHQVGGGCTVDFLHLHDGRVVGINDECICLYENMDRFYDEDGCIEAIQIPRKQTVSYDFQYGQLVELREGKPSKSWDIHTVPDDVLRAALSWNDKDGDFAHTPRVHMLEVFLSDFIQSKGV